MKKIIFVLSIFILGLFVFVPIAKADMIWDIIVYTAGKDAGKNASENNCRKIIEDAKLKEQAFLIKQKKCPTDSIWYIDTIDKCITGFLLPKRDRSYAVLSKDFPAIYSDGSIGWSYSSQKSYWEDIERIYGIKIVYDYIMRH